MNESEILTRKPVWSELANLYLDTELDDQDLRPMATVLALSPYSLAELREIEVWEVAPVVSSNLLSVAGEWAGFDEEWLFEQCERRAKRRSLLRRLAMRLGFRRFVTAATRRYWDRLGVMIATARSGGEMPS
jgi:hypothetical protein